MSENATGRWKKKAIEEWNGIPHLSAVLYGEVMRTRVLTIGAAVAFFALMSLVPLLMMLSALLSALPIPHLWQQLLDVMALLVPPDAMQFVRTLLASIQTAHPTRILSIGILSYIWAASGAFSSLIEALNIAYDVKQERTWWRDKVQALLLTVVCGGLALTSLLLILAGPPVIRFLSQVVPIPAMFALVWPPLRLAMTFACFVTSVTLLYYLGPNRKVHFRTGLPGAAFAVAIWAVGSLGLDFYIQHFSNYSATYGSLGAIIILMLWLYLTSISILIGAELNAELWKRNHGGETRAAAPGQQSAAPASPLLGVAAPAPRTHDAA